VAARSTGPLVVRRAVAVSLCPPPDKHWSVTVKHVMQARLGRHAYTAASSSFLLGIRASLYPKGDSLHSLGQSKVHNPPSVYECSRRKVVTHSQVMRITAQHTASTQPRHTVEVIAQQSSRDMVGKILEGPVPTTLICSSNRRLTSYWLWL
jgi:hypothetical protein